MEPKELLKPRYKVIADYPGSPFAIGDIITDPDYYERRNEKPSHYTAIFSLLPWWADRAEVDMPIYVKHKNGSVYKHAYLFDKEMYYNQECAGHYIGWLPVGRDFNDYTPADKSEYTQYINSKK